MYVFVCLRSSATCTSLSHVLFLLLGIRSRAVCEAVCEALSRSHAALSFSVSSTCFSIRSSRSLRSLWACSVISSTVSGATV